MTSALTRLATLLVFATALGLGGCASASSDSIQAEQAAETGTQGGSDQMLATGTTAPDFSVQDHLGNTVQLSDFRGEKNVVLIFYPANNTPGCTSQLCTARDDYSKYQQLDAVVFGVNKASAESHGKFAGKHDFPFPLLVDAEGQLTADYGCKGLLGMIKRTVYVIDKDGKIAFAERGMPSTEKILAAIQ